MAPLPLEPLTSFYSCDDEDAYHEYLDEHRLASDREFHAGGHDFTDQDLFYAAGDEPESMADFYLRRFEDREEDNRYRRLEAMYPDARI